MIESDDDKEKFEEIYTRYRRLMYFIAFKVVQNEPDAEDAVQQAFVSIIENLEKSAPLIPPQTKSYVAIIAEHKAIDILRAKKRVVEWDDNIMGLEVEPPGDSGLADAIATLPGRYRELLLLRYDNGYDTMEIAKMFDMKRGTVQKMIWRAKEMLSKRWPRRDTNDARDLDGPRVAGSDRESAGGSFGCSPPPSQCLHEFSLPFQTGIEEMKRKKT